jgi:hypothetical protein
MSWMPSAVRVLRPLPAGVDGWLVGRDDDCAVEHRRFSESAIGMTDIRNDICCVNFLTFC